MKRDVPSYGPVVRVQHITEIGSDDFMLNRIEERKAIRLTYLRIDK
jgi:hypothetical protein